MLGLCLAALFRAGDALACAVCFGDPSSAQVKGAEAGILVLFGVVGCVLLSIAGVALFWARRARNLAATPNAVVFLGSRKPGLADVR